MRQYIIYTKEYKVNVLKYCAIWSFKETKCVSKVEVLKHYTIWYFWHDQNGPNLVRSLLEEVY